MYDMDEAPPPDYAFYEYMIWMKPHPNYAYYEYTRRIILFYNEYNIT
jgi:hypothetical protein